MLTPRAHIIDYRMGNLTSVKNAIEHLGYEVVVATEPEQLKDATHIILPGVGSFHRGMERLNEFGFTAALQEEVGKKKKPLLGICLGMQLLADRGLEHGETNGLGLIPGVVRKLESKDLNLPHIGWNNIQIENTHPAVPFQAAQKPDFYFVHSFCFETKEGSDVLATTEYGEKFAAVVARGSALGVQFHPEKSQKSGLGILKAFMEMKYVN